MLAEPMNRGRACANCSAHQDSGSATDQPTDEHATGGAAGSLEVIAAITSRDL